MYNNCSSSAAASDLSCVGLYGESNAFCSGGLVDVWLEMSVSGVFIIVCVSASRRQTFTSRFTQSFTPMTSRALPTVPILA